MSYRLSRTNPDCSRQTEEERETRSKLFFVVEGAETEGRYLSAFQKQFLQQISGEIILLDRIDITQSNQYIIAKTIEKYQDLLSDLEADKISKIEDIFEEISDDPSMFTNKIEPIKKLIGDDLYNVIFGRITLIANNRSIVTVLEALTAISELKYFNHSLDKIILVLDRDTHSFTSEQYDLTLAIVEKNGYLLGISNPCFELFLLLHLTNLSEYCHIKIKDNIKKGKKTHMERVLATFLSKNDLQRTYNKSTYNAEVFTENFKNLQKNIVDSQIETDIVKLKSDIGTSLYSILADICPIEQE